MTRFSSAALLVATAALPLSGYSVLAFTTNIFSSRPFQRRYHVSNHYQAPQSLLATLAPTEPQISDGDDADNKSPIITSDTDPLLSSLTDLFPNLSSAIANLGISAPTPIQQSSATRALDGENLLFVAPTGSGKTLAYLLPAITKAIQADGTVLIVAPTRELAVQLLRDSVSLLEGLNDINTNNNNDVGVRLSVRGVDLPILDDAATVLIGTPPELYATLLSHDGSQFLNGLSGVILDEVDVLLPPTPKMLRTSLDKNKGGNSAQDERRKKEQKRKMMAAKRRGTQLADDATKRILSDTEQILGLVANSRMPGAPQIMAGSATASRKTLDRLNQALRTAAAGAAIPLGANVKLCRPADTTTTTATSLLETDATDEAQSQQPHTIRAVTVPAEVQHRYIELSKESASSPERVFSAVATAASMLQPKTALLFLCGEFGKPNTAEKAAPAREIRGATSQARRNSKRKSGLYAKANAKAKTKQSSSNNRQGLSARKACKLLSELDIVAQPLHVALGLELQAMEETEDDDDDETSPFLVTFEGSARGLHFDGVDVVFVVGRPSSAASYLHLAGRVGRASADEEGNVVVRPGTVVSICTKGSATELEKWTKQIGGLELKEMK